MSTGFNRDDGTLRRLVCAGPPDSGSGSEQGGGSGVSGEAGVGGGNAPGGGAAVPTHLGPDDFIPNCCINGSNGQRIGATVDTTAAGASDLTIEVWAMPFGPSSASLGDCLAGHEFAGSSFILYDGDPVSVAAQFDNVGGGWVITPYFTLSAGWNHIAATFDRSGLMTLFINGVSMDTQDISAFVAEVSPAGRFRRVADTAAVLASGPFAWHTTLLTAAQIRDSIARRSVQILTTTQGAWDWRHVVGHTGWEARESGADFRGYYGGGPNADQPIPLPWAMPIGVNGTVSCRDLSGNDRGLFLDTAAVYPTASRGVTLGSDPFFK